MGFDDKGIVALSGAHTIGRAFRERSGTVKEGYGEMLGWYVFPTCWSGFSQDGDHRVVIKRKSAVSGCLDA